MGVLFYCNTTSGLDMVRGSGCGVDFGHDEMEKNVVYCDGVF